MDSESKSEWLSITNSVGKTFSIVIINIVPTIDCLRQVGNTGVEWILNYIFHCTTRMNII